MEPLLSGASILLPTKKRCWRRRRWWWWCPTDMASWSDTHHTNKRFWSWDT